MLAVREISVEISVATFKYGDSVVILTALLKKHFFATGKFCEGRISGLEVRRCQIPTLQTPLVV